MVSKALRTCPKCGGKMGIDKDEYGYYEQCIQCGYLLDIKIPKPQPQPIMRYERQV
jgi:hypothetical protein